jgi:hypothetical protein
MRHVDPAYLETLSLPTQFPASYFPHVIERYRQNLIEKNQTPGEFVAAGMLAAFSAATGNSLVGRFGTKRFIPASLYLLMVGNPGTGKTPALIHTLEPVRREQAARERAVAEFMASPAQASLVLPNGGGCEAADTANDTSEGESLEMMLPPEVRYIYLTDATIPAVHYALCRNQRGLVMVADEALSLFKGPGKGGDRPIWLQIWNADNVTIARRSGKPPVVTIPRSFVTVVAGIQPDLFPRLRNPDGDDGLLDRFLLVGDNADGWPPYSHGQIDPGDAATYHDAVDRLIQHRDGGCCNTSTTTVLPIDADCSDRFESLHNRLTALLKDLHTSRRYGGLITKMVANAQRLAVLRAGIRWSVGENGGGVTPDRLNLSDANAACQAAEFCFGRALLWRPELINSVEPPTGHSAGTNARLGDHAHQASRPCELAEKIIGYMTRRGISHVGVRKLRSSGSFGEASSRELRSACQLLIDQGRGRWIDKPGREFSLLEPNNQTNDGAPAGTMPGENP